LVPAEAVAAVVVESPYKLYAAAEEFWKAAGLDKTMGSDLQDLLKKSVPSSAQALQTLDFARPWALAVLPAGGPGKTREVLYIPFRSKPDDLVAKLFGSGAMKLIANAKGYLVLSDAEGELAFPPAKGADLSRLARYPAASVQLWGDPAGIRRAVTNGYTPIEEAIRRFVTAPSSADGPQSAADLKTGRDPKAATKALGELGVSLLAQLGLADAALEPSASGLVLRAGVAAKAGSDLQKTIKAASFAPSALDWAPQVSAGAMEGFAWSMDPSIASGLYAQLTESLFSSLGLSKDMAAKSSALQAKWAKAAGPRGALSLDLDIDASAISGAKDLKSEDPAAIADLVKKMLRIRFDLFQEVKDEAGFRALIKGLASDPDYLAFSKAYADAFGLSIAIKNQDKKDGAFSYGELGLALKVLDAAKLGSFGGATGSDSADAAAESAIAALASLVSARWTISNGRFVATGGDSGALKALAARKAADKSLSADPVFAAFAKTMPPKTFMVGSLSMRKLLKMASDIMTSSGSAAATIPDPSLFGSWYSYFAIDTRALAPPLEAGFEAGFLMPASDIGALVKLSGTIFKSPSKDGGA
jgi:hypothetical protein